MIETIEFKGTTALNLQTKGNAMQYALPFFKQIIGDFKNIADIGVSQKEWGYPGADHIDLAFNDGFHAMNLPPVTYDFLVSSHFLEHYIGRFEEVIEYWLTKIRKGGAILLYLPNCNDSKYWAFENTKHIHYLTPDIMSRYCAYLSYDDKISRYFVTQGSDLNASFYVIIEK
jgi:hypothetical protein